MAESLCEVTFLPQGTSIKVPKNTTIQAAAVLHNLSLESLCNGRGICRKCLVKVSGMVSEPTAQEIERLGSRESAGWRLACQAQILGKVEVTLLQEDVFYTVQNGQAREYKFDPIILESSGSFEDVYGIAIDIGTTSIVASLINLKSDGKELITTSCLNPQTKFGGDVITRITFAHESAENTQKLKQSVLSGINQLIERMCSQKNIQPNKIRHAMIAANTTMLHLLVGLDPISLATAPYTPIFVDYREQTASELGINIAPDAIISLLPSLSAFIGADILAGLVAIDFQKVTVPSLFIDIGTNGEIVANVNGKLVATSSAAGPALEGMNIQCGCRAEDGAISGVRLTENGIVEIETIGSAKIKGICGSGLVELVAELVKAKIISPSGKFTNPADLPDFFAQHLIPYDEQQAFVVHPESNTLLTQKDVRQVQLAKAAIAAAIEILFKRLGVDLGAMEQVYIAGAFGYHLKPEALKTIGLLPQGVNAEIQFVGNTAKEGARLCLCSKEALQEIRTLQKTLIPLELSYAPEFMNHYVNHMNFPAFA
ncbi:ASKHA domain-containing protein [Paradesulfitobacterium ferrireducens]|uniref:ASKHA domain-containing protein n=1 Tax=Paradesulfitobacterium ferrireducens TaxID=2816476 RepID=UPI001A8C6406|nr:ASKHA domain-containing protein [Paradesulfitobacterium ferrireducens]